MKKVALIVSIVLILAAAAVATSWYSLRMQANSDLAEICQAAQKAVREELADPSHSDVSYLLPTTTFGKCKNQAPNTSNLPQLNESNDLTTFEQDTLEELDGKTLLELGNDWHSGLGVVEVTGDVPSSIGPRTRKDLRLIFNVDIWRISDGGWHAKADVIHPYP